MFRPGISLVLMMVTALAGCESPMHPDVPKGPSAYQAISPAADDTTGRNYFLRGGDIVSISVFQEPDLSRDRLVIDNAGNLDLPLIGQVHAGGMTPSELSDALTHAYGNKYLRKPDVAVYIDQSLAGTFAVEGQVALPGQYAYRPGDTLLSAIAQARSPTKVAKLDQVLIFRTVNGERLGGQFDLRAIREGRADDPEIKPGDVIVVGFSGVRGVYRDFLEAAPIIGVFRRF